MSLLIYLSVSKDTGQTPKPGFTTSPLQLKEYDHSTIQLSLPSSGGRDNRIIYVDKDELKRAVAAL